MGKQHAGALRRTAASIRFGRMRVARWVTALACVAMVGCGGGDDDEAATPTATQAAEATTEIEDGGGSSAGGGLTEPGTTLNLGQPAHVTYKPLSATDDKNLFDVDATALKIERGSIDDFKNISLDADQKASTPYYVTVKIQNTGREIPLGDADGDPDLKFAAVDDRGQEQGSITFIGDFERCEDTDAPKPFTKGKSYESCLAYLLGGDGSITEVRWQGSDEYILKPVVWK
jgi:hypothetical protein